MNRSYSKSNETTKRLAGECDINYSVAWNFYRVHILTLWPLNRLKSVFPCKIASSYLMEKQQTFDAFLKLSKQ